MKSCKACDAVLADDLVRCLRCGAVVSVAAAMPSVIDGRYQVQSVVGHGAQGVVYLAKDLGLERKVAVKLIHERSAHDPGFVARFKREAVALASVRSENVVQVYAFGAHEGSHFFAMEYVRGTSLAAILREQHEHGTRLPIHRALSIVRQVAQGLLALHGAGVVHRDVKPANIIIEQGTGRPVLIDLGLAHNCNPESTRRVSTVGTPAYMAPEQVLGVTVDQIAAHTDIYALGGTAFHLLTGSAPFEDATAMQALYQQVEVVAPPLSSLRPELAPLDAVVARCLAKNPQDRFPTCSALIAALDRAAAHWLRSRPSTPVPSAAPVAPRRGLRLLVVDDDEAFCAFAAGAGRLALPDDDLQLAIAVSGLEALQMASRSPPDVVVLDYDMPLLDGVATLSYLRDMEGARHAQVLVASADLGRVERWRFTALGVTEFLQKPVPIRTLVAAVGKVAARALERRAASVV